MFTIRLAPVSNHTSVRSGMLFALRVQAMSKPTYADTQSDVEYPWRRHERPTLNGAA